MQPYTKTVSQNKCPSELDHTSANR